MGRVWRAHDLALDVDVAIKEVRLAPSDSAEERTQRLARAQREARNAAQLRDHPNVVAVYDVLIEDERPWIVMNLVHGTSLAELIHDHGPLPAPRALRIAEALLGALAAAHKAGIVHRDVKPANVLLTEFGGVLLTDFGIAKRAEDTALTGTGFIGSIEYVAPERARGGEDAPAGDLFSLGATLYHVVTGTSPFHRDHPAASLSALLSEQPPRPAGAGVLNDLIIGLLAKEPADRPTAAQALAQLSDPAPAPQAATPTTFAAPTVLAPQQSPPEAQVPLAGFVPPAAQSPVADFVPPGAQAPSAGPIPPVPQAAPMPAAAPSTWLIPQATFVQQIAPPADSGPIPAAWLPVQRLQQLTGHRALLLALAFSDDGQVLAGGGADGMVHLWNVLQGGRISSLSGHAGAVNCVAFSPDGMVLASGGADGRVRLCDPRTGRHVVLTGHAGSVESLAFSPDSLLLATGGADHTVRLWDVRTGACVNVLAEHSGPVYTVAVSRDGGTLAGAGAESDLLIWDLRTGARRRRVRFENADLSCFLYGPQGELFIGVHGKGFQYLQEVRPDRPNRAVTGAVDQLCSLALSSDGAVIVTGSENGAIQFWDTASGLEAARLDTHRAGKGSAVLAVAVSRDGSRLATASDDRKVWIHGRPYGYPRPY
jgi:hypothetical protein